MRFIRRLRLINPKNPDVFGYLGYMYRKVHETDLAIKAYEDQICVRPHAAYYTNLGFIYWERRDYEKALENFEQSLAIAPERSDRDIRRKTEVIRFKSRVLLCLNRITEGCQILLDAIHKYGDDMDPQLRIEQVSHSHEQTAIRRQNSCWKAMQRKARMKVCGLTARVF